MRPPGTKAPKVRRNTRCRKRGDRRQRTTAKNARFDANQTPNIANMAFMNVLPLGGHPLRDSFGHEKIPTVGPDVPPEDGRE